MNEIENHDDITPKKSGRGPGRPKLELTDLQIDMIRRMAYYGFSHSAICKIISAEPIDVKTLHRSAGIHLAVERASGALGVAEVLAKRMLDPDVDCDSTRYKYLKHTAGYTDATQIEADANITIIDIADRLSRARKKIESN